MGKSVVSQKVGELILNKRNAGEFEGGYDKTVLEVKEEDVVKDEVKTEEQDENAYDEMLAQIDFDMLTNKVETKKELPVFDPIGNFSNETFQAFVNEDMLCIPPNGNAITSLRI